MCGDGFIGDRFESLPFLSSQYDKSYGIFVTLYEVGNESVCGTDISERKLSTSRFGKSSDKELERFSDMG